MEIIVSLLLMVFIFAFGFLAGNSESDHKNKYIACLESGKTKEECKQKKECE